MFDFLKNLTKSEEDKQQETFSAYLDNTLSVSQRQDFEALIMQDADLRAELEMAQVLRQQMQEMPRRSVPRSFTLDASVYGVPKKEPLVQAYPFLRAATALTAFFFVMALALNVFSSQSGSSMVSMAQPVMEAAPEMAAPMPEAEIAMQEAVEEPTAAKAAEAFMATEEDMAPAEMAQEEAAADMAPAATILPTMEMVATAVAPTAVTLTAVPEAELAVQATEENTMADAASEAVANPPAASAPAGEGAGETALAAATATVSSLPRPDATEAAVSRLAEPTVSAQDEVANAVEMETAVTEAAPYQTAPQPRLSLTNSQWLLIGLGLLLLILVIVTFLARRKI